MATIEPHTATVDHSVEPALVEDGPERARRTDAAPAKGGPDLGAPVIVGPRGWKRRLEDPLNTYYRYPIALAITKLLMRTPVTPNQVSLVQPVFAAGAGYLLTIDRVEAHLGAVALFELRSILDCVDGSLARAKKLSSPNGHAIDAFADWLGVMFLYLGIFHYVFHHVPAGYSTAAAMGIVCAALAQGALRSAASDYFKNKFLGIYERREDDLPETFRKKVLSREQRDKTKGMSLPARVASFFAAFDIGTMHACHFLFELERFDPHRSKPLPREAISQMIREESSARTRFIGFLWSISSGDAFLSFVILSILFGKLWVGQLFFASVGFVWILAVIAYNVVFLRGYRRTAIS